MLCLLQAGMVQIDVDKMSLEGLIALLGFCLVAIVVIFTYGINFKWKDKEIIIGGLRRFLSKKDEDTILKENLYRFAQDVDKEIEADLFELIEDIDDKIQILIDSDHCYFTLQKFSGLVKNELYNRVRRNNLKEKLCEDNREKYIDRIISNIQKRYEIFYVKASATKCNDIYQTFPEIKNRLKTFICEFFDGAVTILIRGYRKKIKKYKEEQPNFKTATMRKFCCDDCIVKNEEHIQKLLKVDVRKKSETEDDEE